MSGSSWAVLAYSTRFLTWAVRAALFVSEETVEDDLDWLSESLLFLW